MAQALKRTPLYELHCELGAKLTEFAGYEMPVQYSLGILGEHQHTRTKAGLFDVSHMGQITLRGSCLLYTSPSPRDAQLSRMPSSA